MNKQETMEKIESLKQAAEGLEGATKTFKLDDISRLKIKLEGMSISEVADKMSSISLPDISDMNEAIEDASDSIKSHEKRVNAFNKAFSFLKTSLGVIV
jgi:hypothetical protein